MRTSRTMRPQIALYHTLTPRQLNDLELILNGAFAPLSTFMCKAEYESVVTSQRLPTGVLFPIPVVLDIDRTKAKNIEIGAMLTLVGKQGEQLATLCVEEKWIPDRYTEARSVYGTESIRHPGVRYLLHHTQEVYLSGKLIPRDTVTYRPFADIRYTPCALLEILLQRGWHTTLAFQTRNPLHKAHIEAIKRAQEELSAGVLLHPTVGETQYGDVDPYTRVRCYREVMPLLPFSEVILGVLPLAMRMAGPREAVWHALVRKNYGATHFIVGRDHAGPSKTGEEAWYAPYEAQEYALQCADELGIAIVAMAEIGYIPQRRIFGVASDLQEGERFASISGSEIRLAVEEKRTLPEWYTYPAVAKILGDQRAMQIKIGLVVLITGLPASGKTAIAYALAERYKERGECIPTVYDGDEIRNWLTKGLGFSREDRRENLLRVTTVAAEIARHGGTVILSLVAPYQEDRAEARRIVETYAHFVEIYNATPLEVCKERDPKKLYQKAARGEILHVTGVTDPYEAPQTPELQIDTSSISLNEVIVYIEEYLKTIRK